MFVVPAGVRIIQTRHLPPIDGAGEVIFSLRRHFRVESAPALLTCLLLPLLLIFPSRVRAQTSKDSGPFQLKLSGFENLVSASSTTGPGAGAGGSTESEVE